MPQNPTLIYNPATPEGQHISNLFHRYKNTPEGDDHDDDVIETLWKWFTELGIDPEGHAYQADALPPQAIAPAATATHINRLLTDPALTPDNHSTPHQDLYRTEESPQGCDDYDDCTTCNSCALITFPDAPAPLVRSAVALLRRTGYDARQVTAPAPASAVHVTHSALYTEQPDASPAQRAERILWLGGFTALPEDPYLPRNDDRTGLPPVTQGLHDWMPVAPLAPHRDDQTEAARALFTRQGWHTATTHGTNRLHVTPPAPGIPGEPV